MAARKSPIDENADPHVVLAEWVSRRYGAHSEYLKIINLRENELLDASGKVGPRSPAYQTAKADLQKAEIQRDGIQGVLRRPLNKYHVRWMYFAAFAVALALLEAPVNKFLFDVALQSIGIFSFLASVVLAFCLLILAHMAGKSVRQVWSEYRHRIVWSSLVVFLLISFVLATVVSILTVGRAVTAATAMVSFQDMFSAVQTTMTSQGVWGALTAAFSDISALILATVNIGGIFAALMLAFFTHDPDKDFDAAATEVDHLRAKIENLDKHFAKSKAAVIARHAPDLLVSSTNFKNANMRVIQAKKRLGQPLDEEDNLMIDQLDTLAEDSELGETAPSDEADYAPPPPSPSHIVSVDGRRRA
jgi:hypothetical protein